MYMFVMWVVLATAAAVVGAQASEKHAITGMHEAPVGFPGAAPGAADGDDDLKRFPPQVFYERWQNVLKRYSPEVLYQRWEVGQRTNTADKHLYDGWVAYADMKCLDWKGEAFTIPTCPPVPIYVPFPRPDPRKAVEAQEVTRHKMKPYKAHPGADPMEHCDFTWTYDGEWVTDCTHPPGEYSTSAQRRGRGGCLEKVLQLREKGFAVTDDDWTCDGGELLVIIKEGR